MPTREKRIIFKAVYYSMPFLILSFLMMLNYVACIKGFWPSNWGAVKPHDLHYLKGVLFAPFFHGSWSHLISNIISLIVLGALLRYTYPKRWGIILLSGWIFTGFWTWLAAREAYHIGASGIVYMLFGFLAISGFIKQSKKMIWISFLTIFEYGSMVWGILPIKQEISWESHAWGLVSGILLEFVFKNDGLKDKLYVWDDSDVPDGPDAYWRVEKSEEGL